MKYHGYLFDLDGTMYRGKEDIDSAVRFVNNLAELDIPYMFVTNNSAKTPDQVVADLLKFEIPASREQVITSSLATARYIRKKSPQATVYMIGEEGLKSALNEQGLTIVDEATADFVVIGIDRNIDYEKYVTACLAIQNGATFLATNADKKIPTERGFVPGNGALASVVTTATGRQPTFIGKPERFMIDQALEQLQVAKHEVVLVGDNYDTDIRAGMNAGIDTILVLTGVTQKTDLPHVPQFPTHIVANLDEWNI